MGSLCSRRKKKSKELNNLLEEGAESNVACHQPFAIRSVMKRKKVDKVELTFRKKYQSREGEVKSFYKINDLVKSQEWIVNEAIMKDLAQCNILEWIEKSPALALQITLKQSESSLIQKRNFWNHLGSTKDKYSLIYADLFRIQFLNLKKIKINSNPKEDGDQIISFEPLTFLEAPFLEELTANGHPITNISFLRRCHWPFLCYLSFRDNAIIDSKSLGEVLSNLSNVSHLQGVDVSGLYSQVWSNVSWILKLGFCDAKLQALKLEEDSQYKDRFFGKTLSRVDCNLSKNRLVRSQVKMIRRKFNNSFFENPISLW